MSGSPQWPLQVAIYERLSADHDLTQELGANVFDDPPAGGPFPYLVIGDVTEVPQDTFGRTGRDLTVTIHFWSQHKGFKQVKEIHNRVDELLDRWAPTIEGWLNGPLLNEFFETTRDPDGITRHGVARYRIHTHQ